MPLERSPLHGHGNPAATTPEALPGAGWSHNKTLRALIGEPGFHLVLMVTQLPALTPELFFAVSANFAISLDTPFHLP
jgi:hypothetical protein